MSEENEQQKEGRWIVAQSDGETLKVRKEGFALMVDSDAWIKENITEGEVLVSIRIGVPRKLQVVRRLAEVEL